MNKSFSKLLPALLFFSLGVLYIFCSPFTVQSGDTGELVTNSYFLRVSHPPGYPLWTLLYHIPTRYLNFGNPFAAASIFTSLIGLLSLTILYLLNRKISTLLVILVLGTATVVWRYFLLPDVFALNVLFLTFVFWIFCRPNLLDYWWTILLISLAVAHHHTIVFCFPMFVYGLYKSGLTKKKLIHSLLFGCLSFLIYFIFLTFHPLDYGSWGNLTSVEAVVKHFLRLEYGTFSLAQEEAQSHSWSLFFLKHLVSDCWSLILILFYILLRHQKKLLSTTREHLLVVSCLISYILVFEFLARISFDVSGESTFERFLIMPIFFFSFFVIHFFFHNPDSFNKWFAPLLIANLGTNLWSNFDQVNYKNKTGIHDLVVNSLSPLPEKSIFFTYGDTFGYAAYYLHEVKGLRKDIYLLHSGWEFNWSSKKAKNKYPEIFKNNNSTSFVLNSVNLEKYKFYSNYFPRVLPESIQISYEGIVFHYSLLGLGKIDRYQCQEKFVFLTKPKLSHFSSFEENAYFDNAYGGCNFDLALTYMNKGEYILAKKELEKATMLSPFSAKYLERLCHVLELLNSSGKGECDSRLNILLTETSSQYYLNKFEL